MRKEILIILATAITALGAEPPDWPKTVMELKSDSFIQTKSGDLPPGICLFHREETTLQRENRKVGVFRVDLDGDGIPEIIIQHDEGGTAGRYYSIYKKHKGEYEEIGWFCGYNVRLLKAVNHWLMIEAWTRGGGTDSSRMLMKYEKGKYRCVRLDEYKTSEDNGKKYVKTKIPKEGEE